MLLGSHLGDVRDALDDHDAVLGLRVNDGLKLVLRERQEQEIGQTHAVMNGDEATAKSIGELFISGSGP